MRRPAVGPAIIAATRIALRRLRLGQWPQRQATHAPANAAAPAETQPVAPELKKAA